MAGATRKQRPRKPTHEHSRSKQWRPGASLLFSSSLPLRLREGLRGSQGPACPSAAARHRIRTRLSVATGVEQQLLTARRPRNTSMELLAFTMLESYVKILRGQWPSTRTSLVLK